jgi:hypothetical protein
MNYKKLFILSIGCILLALLLTAGNFDAESTKLNHCYALLSPIRDNSDESSRMVEMACFDTFSQAIHAATGGRVQLDPSTRPEDVTEELLNRVERTGIPAAQVVIGIDWDYTYYGGSSYTWVVSETGCTPSIQYSVSSMPAGWNDRVSSAKAYSNCKFYHYRDANFGGPYVICNPNCATMGSLDNATSSEKWIYSP